ncbi:FAD-dependent oxidoreductase [Amycolatopsis sp. BJA-103]|uniref:FAD-dependent oxidoreductase n=1 Tax=Amycolatopsis sp. BJA-103 TaxID=1911175 RepID=UPI000C75B497|nr:FAD-dependent oxidoreductase [Amycolatopsis sp. BJA-103]AUI58823.1 FAD-dependent oxidoreductase [Amycolatopsis sp. BJA-103]PNE17725.1 FAD-dependent oxidoreductase [Amycolatopsis sp. BJA-103]
MRNDVIVVGAGPTGLFLASELALRGVRVTVLERLEEPDQTIKSGSINVASAEILDRRGLLPAAEEVQRGRLAASGAFTTGRMNRTVRALEDAANEKSRRFAVIGHFAGLMFRHDLVDQDDPVLAAHTAVANGIWVPQHDLELLLGAHCARLGVEIRRGVEVRGLRGTGTGLDDDADVVVETSAGDLTAGWVVAADGGRSIIRRTLGVDFAGTDPELVGYQAIADFDDPGELRRGWNWTPRGIYTYGPVPGRILVARFAPQPEDRDAPVTVGELQSAVREVSGVPVTITGLHGRATRWSDNARQAQTYRRGRVFLAGDAAHVHSPFSAQGLNLGLGDAVNLGWKLAATILGTAPAGLLDTYHSERHPIGAWVLDWTRAQVALMRGDERTAQLRKVIDDDLFTVPGATNHMITLSSGILQRYDVAEDGEHPVGSITGDAELSTGGRLADHAHDGRFVLVDRSAESRYAEAVRGLEHLVAYVADPDASQPSLFVRPDGIIAWADNVSDDNARKLLDTAIERWAGV